VERITPVLRLTIPAIMFGMIAAISFIEAPLKFLAPGITIELGLGIGRLVFTALNISTVVLMVVLTVACMRPRVSRGEFGVLIALWAVVVLEVLVVRPMLNARTDAVLAGTADSGSILHYLYIACDVAILGLLVAFVVLAARSLLPVAQRTPPAEIRR
jgi:hypothetical protein